MMKATVAKLAVLIFLAFIVCLPEYFPPEVLQVQFLCAPFDPCAPDRGHDQYDGQVYRMYGDAGITHPRCEAKNATNQDEAVKEWFACETHADLRRLCDNASFSETAMEAIVTLHITAPLPQTVTVNGHFNHSGLHIETQHNVTLFGCCIQNDSTNQNKDKMPQASSLTQNSVSHKPNTSEPGVFSAGSPDVASSEGKNSNSNHTQQTNRSRCLFHFKDIQRTSSKTVKRWSISTIAWMVLVLMVVILVLLGVRDQVFKSRYCCQKKVRPVLPLASQSKTFSKRRVKSLGDLPDNVSAINVEDKELFLEKTPSDYSRAGLSPIPELSVTDVSLGETEDEDDEEADGIITKEASEVYLDIPLTPANTHENFTFLHHRSHPSVES